MKNCFRFSRACLASLAMLLFSVVFASNASAQLVTILSSQGFTSSSPWGPSSWTGNFGTEHNPDGSWFWTSAGSGGSNGSPAADLWFGSGTITTPSENVSAYANSADMVWVDFDFYWEYGYYCATESPLDQFEVLANSDVLLSGTQATLNTYYNTSDAGYDVIQTSSSYWTHYHILVPVSDRTSGMTISFKTIEGWGCSDCAIDNVTITGFSVPPPELSLTPKSINFGTAALGVPVQMTATVNSVGAAGTNLKITGTALSGSPAYSIVSGPAVGTLIPQGSSAQYVLQFAPFSSGTLNGIFTVATSGADSGTQSLTMTGIGSVPSVSYSTNNMFRGVNTRLTFTSKPQYLYVNSTGVAPLSIFSVSFYGLNKNDYVVTHVPANTIPPGGVDSIGLVFTPDFEGVPDAHMVINTNAANIPWDTVSLYGVGILPHLAVDSAKSWPLPTTVNFDSVLLGATACLPVLLTNPGSDTVAITQNYYESSDFDFAITKLTGADTLIPPGGSQTIQVCFTPLQQGTRVATLRIRTNIPHTIQTPTQPVRDTSQFVVNIIGIGVPSGKLVITGPATNGNALLGKPAIVVDTFWNTGGASLTITGVTIGGTNGADFKTAPALPLTLGANSHSTFTLTATPSDTGAEIASLTAAATSNGSPLTASLALAVYGQLIADMVNTGTALSTLTCDTESATVMVTNNGNVSDTYTAAIGTGADAADFKITSPSSSGVITGGGSFTYTILFTPSKAGPESAQVNVTRMSDGNVTGPLTISGTGGAATIGGQGTAATAMPSGPTETFTDTLTNTGTCPWTPGIPGVISPFIYVSGGTTAIPAGGTGYLTMQFTPPPIAGKYSAAVIFPNQVGVSIPAAINTVYGTVSSAGVSEMATSNGYSLEQNYPNPFSNESQLQITLPVGGMVHLSIIDVQGQVVQTVLNQHFDAGTFGVSLHADGLASGTYYYQMTSGNVTLTRQMVVIK
jgi:hypothetical protein